MPYANPADRKLNRHSKLKAEGKQVLHIYISSRHKRIIELARMLFGSTNAQIIGAAVELYEKKFRVLETGRRFMEDGTLVVKKGEETLVQTETARIDYVKRSVEQGGPNSVFDEPIPKEKLEALLSEDNS